MVWRWQVKQVHQKIRDGKPHAWFIGYAVKDDVKRSFVVLLENAGHGGDEAAPIVRQILSYIYKENPK